MLHRAVSTKPATILLLTLMGGAIILSPAPAALGQQRESAKYARCQVDQEIFYAVVEGDRVRRLEGDLFAAEPKKTDQTYALEDVELLVPTTPTKVLALAGNFRDHLADQQEPERPEPFFKPTSSLQKHEGDIHQPEDGEPVHHEAELVVVIGKQAQAVNTEDALDYVFGVTCGNDISARDWQANDRQWWRAKGSDTFGPCGPFIATGLDYGNLNMECRVNGEVRQKTNTKNMIHSVADVVSFISHYVTLEPGDLIFMGTSGETTPMYQNDVVEIEIEGVGLLRNNVIYPK